MSVTQEITEAVGAPAYDPRADQTADLRAHLAAVATAEAARAAAGPTSDDQRSIYGLSGESRGAARDRHDAELGRLLNAWPEARSTALRRAIDAVVELKVACQAAAEHDMKHGLEGDAETWPAARDALIEAAFALAEAPISNATDALVRAECFIDAVDRNPTTGLPEDDSGNHPILIETLKSAVSWLALQEPDADEWDGAVRAYRKAVHDLDTCAREEASFARAAIVEDVARLSLSDRANDAQGRRDEATSAILRMEPPHVGGLLVQLEMLADRFSVDLTSYTSREAALGDDPVSGQRLWEARSDEEALKFGLALVAINAAKLRDRSYPSDWRAMLDGFLSVHEGGRDAVRAAYDAELLPSDLVTVVLDPRGETKQPVLLFRTIHDEMIQARPGEVWKWEPVK